MRLRRLSALVAVALCVPILLVAGCGFPQFPSGTDHNRPLINGSLSRGGVHTLTGSFSTEFTDIAIDGRGPSPLLVRTYNSNDPRVTSLGPGWTHSYATRLTFGFFGEVVLVGPQGRSDQFTPKHDGSGDFLPPAGVAIRLHSDTTSHTYTATLPDMTSWTFDVRGRLASIADRYGNTSVLEYDQLSGLLVKVHDPAGRDADGLQFSYDADGHLTTVRDWINRTVTYSYDTCGRLIGVVDREHAATTFGYENPSDCANFHLITITDANHHTQVNNHYDSSGRVDAQVDVARNRTDYDWSVEQTGKVTYPGTSFQPGFRPTQTDVYTAEGWLQSDTLLAASGEPSSSVQYTYDANSFLASVTDARGNITNYCNDASGNVTRIVGPASLDAKSGGTYRPISFARYDSANNVTLAAPPLAFGDQGVNSTQCDFDMSGIAGVSLYRTEMSYLDPNGQVQPLNPQTVKETHFYTDPDSGPQAPVATTFVYDVGTNPGRLRQVVAPRGDATRFDYYPAGQLSGMLQSVTGPPVAENSAGNTASFTYDPVGRRTSMIVPPNTDPPTAQEAGERTFTYTYDGEDRLVRLQAPPVPLPPPSTGLAAPTSWSQYDPVGNRTVSIDPNGQVTTYAYDERNNLVGVHQSPVAWRDPDPSAPPPAAPSPEYVTTYAYDALGNLTQTQIASNDPSNARVVDYQYDGLDQLRSETEYPQGPGGPKLSRVSTFDAAGNMQSFTDPLGQTTRFVYDELNRMRNVTYGDGATPSVTYTYDADGNRVTMRDTATGLTNYTFDEQGRMTQATAASGASIRYRYGPDGNRRRIVCSDGTAVDYEYDAAGRLTRLRDWQNRELQYEYNQDDSLARVFNASVNGTLSEYQYDAARRMTQVQHLDSPDGVPISQHTYLLDLNGNRVQLDEFVPDVVDLFGGRFGGAAPVGPRRPLGAADVALGTAPGASGAAAATVSGPTPSPPASPSASPSPLPTSAASGTPSTSPSASATLARVPAVALNDRSRDPVQTHLFEAAAGDYHVRMFNKSANTADVVVQHAASGVSLGFTLNGAPSERSRQGDTATARVGAATVRWTTFNDRVEEAVVLDSRPAGDQVTFSVAQTGLHFTPDGAGGYRALDSSGVTRFHVLPASVQDAAGKPGNATLSLNGNVATIHVDPAFLATARYPITIDPQIHFIYSYTYDALNRLSTATLSEPLGLTSQYGYDAAGNRTSQSVAGFGEVATYDRADRLQSAGALQYTVNPNGNLVCRTLVNRPNCAAGQSFTYDQANRLTRVSGPISSSATYDGDGNRVSLTVAGSTRRYVFDVNRDLPVLLEDGANKYVWGVGLAYVVHANPNGSESTGVYHADGLGSPRVLTDERGHPLETLTYDAWGVPAAAFTALGRQRLDQAFGFAGEQQDPGGTEYVRARMYEPSIGRFMQRDTELGALDDPQSLNRYSYAGDDPTTRVDPSGQCLEDLCAGEALAAAGICAVGAATGIAGDYAIDQVTGTGYSWNKVPASAATGCAGAFIGLGIGKVLGWGVRAASGAVLQRVVTNANARLAADLTLAARSGLLTPGQLAAGGVGRRLASAEYGNAVERLAGASIRNNRALNLFFSYESRPFVSTPDIIGRGPLRWLRFDVTTEAGRPAHLLRYGNDLQVLTYERPAGFHGFP